MKSLLLLALIYLAACSVGESNGAAPTADMRLDGKLRRGVSFPVSHVVVIVQENRSFDDLLNGFPNANTVRYGQNSQSQQVPLQPEPLTAPYDVFHTHTSFKKDYANGHNNGFDKSRIRCVGTCPPPNIAAYGYVPEYEVQPYWNLALQYTVADNMFQSNEGPSFPAHQYIISGTSTIANGSSLKAAENAPYFQHATQEGGCDSVPGTTVTVINAKGKESQGPFPCYERLSIMDLLDQAGLSWKYYQAFGGPGNWNGVDAIKQIWKKPEFANNVVWPPSQVLTDIANGSLAAVSFVTPTKAASDHALVTDGSGPAWVASVVNAIGQSPYWNSTVIFVTWDDWGGWYDHVVPAQYDSYELGFRVPLLVISPHAKGGYVSHVQHEFGSILKFIEEAFGLPSLGTTDARADDLSDCFSASVKPRQFRHIHAKFGATYFLRQPVSRSFPDDN